MNEPIACGKAHTLAVEKTFIEQVGPPAAEPHQAKGKKKRKKKVACRDSNSLPRTPIEVRVSTHGGHSNRFRTLSDRHRAEGRPGSGPECRIPTHCKVGAELSGALDAFCNSQVQIPDTTFFCYFFFPLRLIFYTKFTILRNLCRHTLAHWRVSLTC